MSSMRPVAVYGLEVPPGDVITPAVADFPATFRVTMAAIDPSAQPDDMGDSAHPPRATLKIIRAPGSPDESEMDSEDEEQLRKLIAGDLSDDDNDESDEESKAGPSDPSKALKVKQEKAAIDLKKALEDEEDEDVKMNGHHGINGTSSNAKGKQRATEADEDDEDELDLEQFVLCTLDPVKNYQQPLDIVVAEDENVFFKVSGTHTVYLTGNYLVPDVDRPSQGGNLYYDEDEEDFDLSPDEDEMDIDEESDDLDDLDDPRITELESEDEEPPKLVKKEIAPKSKQPEPKKSAKNKRQAEDEEPTNLDDIMAKSLKPEEKTTNGEPKLSKKQLKKMKNNAGQPADAPASGANDKKGANGETGSKDKKVQFAKNLENDQPVGTGLSKPEGKVKNEPGKNAASGQSLGVKTVQGVVIDDRKLGTGPAAKNGDHVSLRYIGKLQNGTVFDANKSGTPFRFKLGAGEVVKGWDIGIKGMTAGAERRITIPPQLGYGKKPMGKIPANSTLVFEVKLLSIG